MLSFLDRIPPRQRTLLFVLVCGLLASVLGYKCADRIASFLHFEYLGTNLRATLFSHRPATQSRDITLVTIDEKELAPNHYIMPIDRDYLSKVLIKLEAYRPKGIVIDLLYDRYTDGDKDAELQETLRNLKVPVVLAYADSRSPQENRAYQRDFLSKTGRRYGYANLLEEAEAHNGDFEVTKIPGPPPALVNGKPLPDTAGDDRRCSLSEMGARPDFDCPGGQPDAEQIDWLLTPKDNSTNFASYWPRDIRDLNAADAALLAKDDCKHGGKIMAVPDVNATRDVPFLHCRIILLGAMMPYQDLHKTPVSSFSDFTGVPQDPPPDTDKYIASREVPGMVIQAFAIQQRLEHRHLYECPSVFQWILAVIVGVAGAASVTLKEIEEHPRYYISLCSLLLMAVSVVFSSVFDVLLPGNIAIVSFAAGVFLYLAYLKNIQENQKIKEAAGPRSWRPHVHALYRVLKEVIG